MLTASCRILTYTIRNIIGGKAECVLICGFINNITINHKGLKMLRRSYAQGCIIEWDCYLLGQARYLILAEEGKFKTMVLDMPDSRERR